MVSRFGDGSPEAAKMLGTVLHLHRGTPYVYQGEELGMTNFPFTSIDEFRDIESLNHYAEAGPEARCRHCATAAATTPARRCSGTPHRTRGSPPARRGWPSTRTTRRSTPRRSAPTPDSVFHHYRRLIELRHTEPAVAHGDFTMLLEEDERVYAFTRRHEDTELLVLGNFSGEEVPVDLTGWEDAELLIGEPGGALRPWESRVYCR